MNATTQKLNYEIGYLQFVRAKKENFKKYGTPDQIETVTRIEVDAEKEVERLKKMSDEQI